MLLVTLSHSLAPLLLFVVPPSFVSRYVFSFLFLLTVDGSFPRTMNSRGIISKYFSRDYQVSIMRLELLFFRAILDFRSSRSFPFEDDILIYDRVRESQFRNISILFVHPSVRNNMNSCILRYYKDKLIHKYTMYYNCNIPAPFSASLIIFIIGLTDVKIKRDSKKAEHVLKSSQIKFITY